MHVKSGQLSSTLTIALFTRDQCPSKSDVRMHLIEFYTFSYQILYFFILLKRKSKPPFLISEKCPLFTHCLPLLHRHHPVTSFPEGKCRGSKAPRYLPSLLDNPWQEARETILELHILDNSSYETAWRSRVVGNMPSHTLKNTTKERVSFTFD